MKYLILFSFVLISCQESPVELPADDCFLYDFPEEAPPGLYAIVGEDSTAMNDRCELFDVEVQFLGGVVAERAFHDRSGLMSGQLFLVYQTEEPELIIGYSLICLDTGVYWTVELIGNCWIPEYIM